MSNDTKKAKPVNYTEEQTASIKAAYVAAPTEETVAALAAQYGKEKRSIIMKLVREGVYQKKEYVSKTGEKPTPKAETADAIGKVLALREADITSLEKASKIALVAIWKAITNSVPVEPLTPDETRTKAESIAAIAAYFGLNENEAKGLNSAGVGAIRALVAHVE